MKTATADGAGLQWSGEAQARRAAAVAQAKGYFTETVDAKAVQLNTVALLSGVLSSVGFGVCRGDTFTGCDVSVQTIGSALTLAKAAIARSSDGVVLAVTADLSALMTGTTGKKPCPFLAQHVAPDDDYYWFYFLPVGTTGPILRTGSGQSVGIQNAARVGGTFQPAFGRLAAQADLVLGTAYAPAATGADQALWAGFY